MQLDTFNMGLGAQVTNLYAVGLTGAAGFIIPGPMVLYWIYPNYTGTAGFYLTMYDASIAVGTAGGPVLATTAPTLSLYIKTTTDVLDFSSYGIAFSKGVMFVASSAINITGNPSGATDAAPALAIGYASGGYT